MALVKNGCRNHIGEAKVSNNNLFDALHNPGEECRFEGIYKCAGCGKEVTIAGNKKMPPQNHHQHSVAQGAIRWFLFVYAQ